MDFKLERTGWRPRRSADIPNRGLCVAPGDTIPLGATRTLRVVEVRRDEPDDPPVLVVEDMAESATSAAC